MKPFNAAAFCILMDHHNMGVENAHPDYISEKLAIFENCSEAVAYGMLDAQNQFRLRQWCETWHHKLPE